MKFSFDKTPDNALGVYVLGTLRIADGNGNYVALSPEKVWASDSTSFENACGEEGAVLFFPGDSITITF